jgi:hypothetical protein
MDGAACVVCVCVCVGGGVRGCMGAWVRVCVVWVRRSDMISQLMPSQRSIGRQQKFLITQPRRVCVCVGVGVWGVLCGRAPRDRSRSLLVDLEIEIEIEPGSWRTACQTEGVGGEVRRWRGMQEAGGQGGRRQGR